MSTKSSTPSKPENHQKWAVRKLVCNLGQKHADMLDALVEEAQKETHRANTTTVVEDAIELAYKMRKAA